ncbi:MAG: hypothetical protein UZ04_CHB001000591 [Chlorobi bacterium OLB4]|nr:MAG: hypothetical protein EDM69_03430 [Chlorobiota bacterium]KXK05817.1 MAG: hypothetical protein UZ04_CHB001000591 [Chlorobi bacterium OLB4]MBV6398352.1 hypothetical protein [Ignavibacteria bacterium]MCE7952692.1 hypothetical protein [Chlorobi bacterium CHB7]OQY77833.1 MAG: hypothetical protein B6D43_04805 [Ignavibacteriales bacterium UTCHB1]
MFCVLSQKLSDYILNKNLILKLLLFTTTILFFSSCEKEDSGVIDPNYTAPVIVNITQSPTVVNASSSNPEISFPVAIEVNSQNQISNAYARIFNPGNTMIAEVLLQNSGGNSYSANASIGNISCLVVGVYKIQFQVEDNLGLMSNVFLKEFEVRNPNNSPPFIELTSLPDSVVRPVQDSVLLTISLNANDSDGICDIRSATFDAKRPDGVVFNNLPMVYEGNGIFKFSNYVTSTGLNGYFVYTFKVNDNSNALSQPVSDSIKFVQP